MWITQICYLITIFSTENLISSGGSPYATPTNFIYHHQFSNKVCDTYIHTYIHPHTPRSYKYITYSHYWKKVWARQKHTYKSIYWHKHYLILLLLSLLNCNYFHYSGTAHLLFEFDLLFWCCILYMQSNFNLHNGRYELKIVKINKHGIN